MESSVGRNRLYTVDLLNSCIKLTQHQWCEKICRNPDQRVLKRKIYQKFSANHTYALISFECAVIKLYNGCVVNICGVRLKPLK